MSMTLKSLVCIHHDEQAWITQFSTIVLDPTDPFPEGYMVGDIWGGE